MSKKLLRWVFSSALLLAGLVLAAGCGKDDGRKDAGRLDLVAPLDLPPNWPHGQACDNPSGLCKDKVNGKPLFCIAVTGGAPGRGFCALECKPPVGQECYGVANSTWADCLVQGSAPDGGTAPSYCAFVCEKSGRTYTCPPTLECQAKGSSSDTRLCVPRAK
ncbi:MAG: hypothetical protein KKI08_13185 [Armatimonadetes bacterium]|nr:hypothetical protein [Armatimonadota bacterium]